MKRFINKPFWWAITYSVLLAGFTTFVLLDTFVIPRGIQSVPEAGYTRNDNAAKTTTVTSAAVAPSVTDSAYSGEANDTASTAADGDSYTANSYKDENISITITTERRYDTQVYIADIQLRSVEYLKTAFAQNTFGRNITQKTSAIAEAHNAIFAINGDFCGFRNSGFVIRNGILYRSTPRSGNDDKALVIYENGSFEVVSENTTSASELLNQGAVQVFSFGPPLLIDGEVSVNTNTEVAKAMTSNPRTAIGIIDPLHYIMIVSDGRTKAKAVSEIF